MGPIIAFETPDAWRAWLAENHSASEGVWLRFSKKDSGIPSVTYAEALDEALCFGWIDGQRQKFDNRSYLQKFTPRQPKSGWSKINVGHTERLFKDGRMTAAGLKAIEAAKRRPLEAGLRLAGQHEGAGGFPQNARQEQTRQSLFREAR
jgi:uncharacterized protein YdeI (YjbR/CyaY-like superfamily)